MTVIVDGKILVDGVVVGSVDEYRNNSRILVIGGVQNA